MILNLTDSELLRLFWLSGMLLAWLNVFHHRFGAALVCFSYAATCCLFLHWGGF